MITLIRDEATGAWEFRWPDALAQTMSADEFAAYLRARLRELVRAMRKYETPISAADIRKLTALINGHFCNAGKAKRAAP